MFEVSDVEEKHPRVERLEGVLEKVNEKLGDLCTVREPSIRRQTINGIREGIKIVLAEED